MLRTRISIASLLSLILVLLVTAVLTGFGVFGYRKVCAQEREQLRATTDVLADQLSVALTLPAWNFDHDQIDRIIEGGMQQRDIVSIVVRLAGLQPRIHSRTRDRGWRVTGGEKNYEEPDQFQVSRPILIDGKTLATVEIFVTPRFVEQALARTRIMMISLVLGLDGVLLMGVHLLLWMMVFKPLKEIELYAQAVDSPREESRRLTGRHFFGEMESLRGSLEAMIGLLGSRFMALQKSEEQLRTNEERRRALSDNLPDGMVYQVVRGADGAMRFEYLSAGLERLHGLKREEVMRDAMVLYSQILEESVPVMAAARAESLRTMAPANATVQLRRADGEIRWMQFAATPRRLPGGEVLWDGIELDVTKRKQTEEAVRISEAQYRELFDQMISGLMVFEVILDAQGAPCDYKLVRANPASEKLTGLELTKVVGKTGAEFSMGWPVWLRNKFYHVATSGEPIQYERFNEKLGRFFETRVFSPSPGHFAHVFSDISERKRIETALIDSAERLRLSLRLSGLGVWRRDLRTGAGEWDERMKEIFGREAGSPAPTQEEFYELISPEDRPAIEAAWQEFIHGRGVYDLNFRIVRPNGEERHISTQAMVQKDESGQAVSVTGVNADLTDIVHMTEESVHLRDKLRQAQKMETLGTLAAGIAHDFNNLLTGINGFVELGASTLPADHEAVAMLKQARHGAMSARDLVRRILDFSRKVPDAERKVVKLSDFVRDIAAFITTGLPSQVTLSFDLSESTPAVRADTGQIQQVLMNLCVNGAHAIGSRGGSIRISISERVVTGDASPGQSGPAAAGHYACLTVADTGCGMSAEVSSRIFEPFYTTKRSGEGTGLGLAVVQDIVVDHGGFIRVASEEGKGTTFEIFLPATEEKAVAAKTASAEVGVRGKGERVLIVDDEPFVTAVAYRALTHAGYTAEVYNSSPEAWAHFETATTPYDLLLVDHQMPQLTGEEIVLRVRRSGNTIPIICMSAQIGKLDPVMMQQLGGVRLLSKPFDIDTLLDQVASVFASGP